MSTTDRAASKVPDPIGSPLAAFDSTMRVLKEIGAKQVLDCPAGRGAFTAPMLEAGFDVTCCDIIPQAFELDSPTCDFGDLNDKLPYGDNRFDAITCLNGLQLVWARGRAVREFARVLKPGGHLILTFVNNNNLVHRLMYLMTGAVIHNTIGPPYVSLPEAEEPAAHFRYPMSIAHVASAVQSVGMTMAGVRAVSWSRSSMVLAPLAVFPALGRVMAPKHYRDNCHLPLASSRINLFADYLIVWARK